jgi:hypothetical protein
MWPSASSTPRSRSPATTSRWITPSATCTPRAAGTPALLASQVQSRRKQHDITRPLSQQQRQGHRARTGTQHPDWLVTDLVAVAVRAVQHVLAPALAHARDLGQLVAQAGGHHHPASLERRAAGQVHQEAAVDVLHLALEQLYAIFSHLGPTRRQQLRRGHPVPGQKPVQVRGRGVARLPGVDHGHAPPGPHGKLIADTMTRATSCTRLVVVQVPALVYSSSVISGVMCWDGTAGVVSSETVCSNRRATLC